MRRMTRLQCNREILRILSQEIERQPEIRFMQLLRNLDMFDEHRNSNGSVVGCSNEFYTESEDTLCKVVVCPMLNDRN